MSLHRLKSLSPHKTKDQDPGKKFAEEYVVL